MELQIIRLEINYFLYLLELYLGSKEKILATQSIYTLLNSFFICKYEDYCKDYIDMLDYYISLVSSIDNPECLLLIENIPLLIGFLSTVKKELFVA